MKTNLLLLAFPVLCLACGNAETDSANDAAGTSSPYLAKEVAGVHMVSADANYDEPCNIIGEEFVRGTFNIGEGTELAEVDHPTGCEFEWSGNKVAFAFGGTKPYESIYHAEHAFDKMYQGKKTGQMSEASPGESTRGESTAGEKAALSGPAPAGTASDLPAVTPPGPKRDTSAANDSSTQVSGITSAATHLTEPAISTGNYVAVPGVGDKAVWEPTKGAMHVLYNNHIVSVTVETKDSPAVRKERAQSLAEVMIDKIHHNEYTR